MQQTRKGGSPSDEEVMARVQADDSGALGLLFDRYSRLLFGIALRILEDFGEAEDVVQDTFCSVFQKANLFDPARGTVKTWIVGIAFHRALDRKTYLDRRGFYQTTEIGSLHGVLLGKPDLDREVGASLSMALLVKALEDLPKMQRRTLEMFYFEGLGLREISVRLGEPYGNVRHHFYRGLERLRESAFVKKLRGK